MKTRPTLVWFRQDLRTEDQPALLTAAREKSPLIPVFIWSPEEEGKWFPGEAGRWWLHHSLLRLQKDFKKYRLKLILRRGKALPNLLALIKETGAAAVFWNRRYEPSVIKRDETVRSRLTESGVRVNTFNASLLFEPWQIRNQQGNPYRVFTAYWNRVRSESPPPKPMRRLSYLKCPSRWPLSLALEDLKLLPKYDWAEGIRKTWEPGSRAAEKALRRFQKQSLDDYSYLRDRPGTEGTSRFSPYLHFGEISPRKVWHALSGRRNRHAFLRQLIWREFAHHLLFHFPHSAAKNLNPKFDGFPWKTDRRALESWRKGKTGYPIVDAGMRQLWTTGWMHNRVRMIVGSFLVKDLLIPWQEGAKWFWDTLVDADLANNTMGWQWVAGSGADAAPFFRILNPVLQGEKFDPDGAYVRRWVPEIAALPARWIHRPWAAPTEVLAAAGVRIGESYPRPITDHLLGRRRALLAYKRLRRP